MAQRPIFEQAMLDEGILGTPLEPLARSIYQQESGSGRNTATSYAGATGGMQILPTTFNSIKDPNWDINNPYDNARGGIRYLKQGYQASGGDPRLTAAFYYGGPGGMQKLSNGQAVGDPRNPNAPTTAQYADQVLARAGITNTGNNMPHPNTPDQGLLSQVIQAPQGQGILDRIGNRPGLSEALIGMGAGLLSGTGDSNPAAGLAKGFAGFNAGYSTGMENEKAKMTPLAGGAFIAITRKDGSTEIVPAGQVQQYLLDKSAKDIETWKRKTDYKAAADVSANTQKVAGKEQVDNAGASTQTAANVNELNTIADSLETRKDTVLGQEVAPTGAIGVVPKGVRDLVTPEGAALQDRAEKVIQGSLRATLGAQFTEKEGTRFLERAYNPKQSPAENARRLRDMAKELAAIQADKDNAIAYMKKNGTLEGFVPGGAPTPTAPAAPSTNERPSLDSFNKK